MPTYEYACQSCGHDLEVFQRMSDDPIQVCPECDQPALKRKIGRGAGIIFKGGGFYETDFKQKKGSPDSASTKSASSDSSSNASTTSEGSKPTEKSSSDISS